MTQEQKDRFKPIKADKRESLLSLRDLTDYNQDKNPIGIMSINLQEYLSQYPDLPPVTTIQGPRELPDLYNFDILLFPQEARIKSRAHTFHIDQDVAMRSQMSAVAAWHLHHNFDRQEATLLFPGLIYRRNACFHEADIWLILNKQKSAEIKYLGQEILRHLVGEEVSIKFLSKELYYLDQGFRAKVKVGQSWQTLMSGGTVKPETLTALGIDSQRFSVHALNVSLERAAMITKKVDDPKLFRSRDPRISNQMKDLSPFRPVPIYPAARRNLSIVVDSALTAADVELTVRRRLGRLSLDQFEIVNTAEFEELPRKARERLGISQKERNLLIRIEFSSFDCTLTANEANIVRDGLLSQLNHLTEEDITIPETR